MNPIPVVACANSRLHADVMLIRLRRAGIPFDQISVLCPRRSMPNAVACWLRVRHEFTIGHEPIFAAGRLGRQITETTDAVSMIDLLCQLGFDRAHAEGIEECLEQGHILLGVHAATEEHARIAWHIFKHCEAAMISIGGEWAGEQVPSAIRGEAVAA